MKRRSTIDGFESPEETVEYVLYQIHRGDLDLALRGCAIQEIAENFSLQKYLEIMEEFPRTEMLAPADNGDKAYVAVNQAKLVSVYSDMLEQCMGIFGDGYEMDVLRIAVDIPEDADGFYFQEIRDICAITGARDANNVIVDMLIDGVPRQMKLTVARYRKYWKIIQFSEYKRYKYSEPQISEYTDQVLSESLPLVWESLENKILPCNYQLANSTSEKEIEKLVDHLFLYLQRGEIWKAVSYFDIYTCPLDRDPDSLLFGRQSQAAEQLQEFYYQLLLYDRDQMSWIEQNIKSESVSLISLLDASVMIYADQYIADISKMESDRAECDQHGWWYVRNGTVDWEYTGLAQNEHGWWYVQNGAVDWGFTGLVQNEYGWWYVRSGTIDWEFTGLVQNEHGWWYVENGTVAWNYTGTVTDQGMTYFVVNGHVER
ncbi:MAG: hypothetical protein HFI15_02440 [Lachnospiraceae bacterium]|nr:hypothetical protein [Lachnospiraceae bacterium]